MVYKFLLYVFIEEKIAVPHEELRHIEIDFSMFTVYPRVYLPDKSASSLSFIGAILVRLPCVQHAFFCLFYCLYLSDPGLVFVNKFFAIRRIGITYPITRMASCVTV